MSFSSGTDSMSVAPQGDAACDALAEALCALGDGEATPVEEAQVREHVQECAACARLLEEFAMIDRSLRVSIPDPVSAEVRAPESRFVPTGSSSQPAAPRRTVAAHRAPWTRRIAAVLLAGIAVGLLVVLPGSNADAARIARSVATVEVLQDSERTSQENLRRTLEWELRALRLEVALLSPGGASPADDPADDPAVAVRERLEQLLGRVIELADPPPRRGR